VQIPLCGPSYKLPYIDINNQRCVNLIPTMAGPEGRGKFNLIPTAGSDLLIDLGFDPIRSMASIGGFIYAVAGTSVYKITVNYLTRSATQEVIGNIESTEGTVYVAANPTQIMWVDGTENGYLYTGADDNFVTINDADSDFTGGDQVIFMDGYFIVNEPGSGRFFFSALNNGLSWDPVDVATAESATDNIVGLAVSKGELWVVGEKTTEIWYNAANAEGAPFSNRVSLEIQIGCGAPDSISSVNDILIWLDHRGFIVQSAVSPYIRANNSGYDLQIISDEALTTEILSYIRRDDAIAMSYNDRGHIMYQITFPTVKKTWVYDYITKAWHERSYYDPYNQEDQHHLAQFYCFIDSLHLMSGIRNGKIYLSSDDYTNDNGDVIKRKRVTPVQFDQEDHRLSGVSRIDLRMAIQNHSLENPQITLRYSHDGGHTWSHHLPRSIGAVGEYAKPITWNRLGTGREWVLEFTISEDMKFAIIDAVARPTELEN
jgi:hypothetical protein